MPGEVFDPALDVAIYEHCRPHWTQSGAVVFITIRAADSIPREALTRWGREKQEWLRIRGLGDTTHPLIVLAVDAERGCELS